MALLIVRLLYAFVCIGATAAFCFSDNSAAPQIVKSHQVFAFFIIVSGTLSLVMVDVLLPKKRVDMISAIYFGLLIGILLAHLLNLALGPLFSSLGSEGNNFQAGITMLTLLILPYLCITFMMQTKDQFRFVIPYVEFERELKGGRPMVLDSSALIDGRIADIIETHVIDAQLVVPQFILQEIQDIADSHDKVRRTRGRRGLDILKKLQQDPKVEVKVLETDPAKGKSVDQRLIVRSTCDVVTRGAVMLVSTAKAVNFSGLPMFASRFVICVKGMFSSPSSVGSGSLPVPRLRLPATLSRPLSSSACFEVFFFCASPSTSTYSRCFSGGSCAKSSFSNCSSFSGSFEGVGVATIFGGGVGVNMVTSSFFGGGVGVAAACGGEIGRIIAR